MVTIFVQSKRNSILFYEGFSAQFHAFLLVVEMPMKDMMSHTRSLSRSLSLPGSSLHALSNYSNSFHLDRRNNFQNGSSDKTILTGI